jgi:hypothetical protein
MRITLDNVEELYARLKAIPSRRREQFDALAAYLERETEWLVAPASTRFHMSCEKGLLMHSVGVTYQLLAIKDELLPSADDESAVICGLFHDAGKLGDPGQPLYLKGEEGYAYNPRVTAMGLGVRSLYLVSRYIPLSPDEAQAICCHDGQYIPENETVAHREAPLTLLLHYADYWQAHMYEDEARWHRYIKPE